MADFDYFKNFVEHMHHIDAETAHEQHILEFRAMCAKMISDAIPTIKEQCLIDCRREIAKAIQQQQQKPKHQ